MGTRSLGLVIFLILLFSLSASQAQQPRNRVAPRQPSAPDIKIKYKTNTSGQTGETVTMIKGTRERSEMHTGYGMDIVSITQCDLKRYIQLSDKTRKYLVTPLVVDSEPSASTNAPTNSPTQATRRGGVLTYITSAIDTGERKEMFGFTARHIKTTLTMSSSPDACSPVNQRMETDGWYIDLSFGLDCNLGGSPMTARPPTVPGGCQDRIVTRREGAARTGYPLTETVTMYSADGKVLFTSTKEVLELSRDPLDAALFEVPSGYTETTNSQELYAAPSMAETMGQSAQATQNVENNQNEASGRAETKQPGTIRVGVVTLNNKSEKPVSLETLRERLISEIEGAGIDAVALNAMSQAEAQAEATAKQCDFILYTDISGLKLSAAKKIGGFLGKATGVSGAEKTEARLDFRLFNVGETSPLLQSSATAKEEGEEASVGTALVSEARTVVTEVRKRARS